MDNAVFVIDITDKRNQYLSLLLAEDGYLVEEYDCKKKHYDQDKVYIYILAPGTVINMDFAESIVNGSTVFCLNIDSIVHKYLLLKDIKVIKFFDDEILAMQNAYLTAEGALSYIILNTSLAVKESTVLVLGFGRLGKTITKLLKDIGASVYVGTNPVEEIALAKVVADYTCNLNNSKKHLPYFDVIINTVPALVLDENDLSDVKKDCFILDLASKPGGIDFDKAKELGINTMHALGVPGKTSPKSAAQHIRESIYNNLCNITKGKL